jgi:hypothetical protein
MFSFTYEETLRVLHCLLVDLKTIRTNIRLAEQLRRRVHGKSTIDFFLLYLCFGAACHGWSQIQQGFKIPIHVTALEYSLASDQDLFWNCMASDKDIATLMTVVPP